MEFQAKILVFLESLRNEGLTLFFTTITILAEKLFLIMILTLLYWCIDKEKSKRLAWYILFGAVGNGIFKNIVRVPRPFDVGVVSPIRAETATSYSFPSGHTQSATSFWAGSMIILKTKSSMILGSIMIVLTALSRLYLGVHWPMDVIGGMGFGLICLYFANQFIDESGEIKRGHLLAVSILCLSALIFKTDADCYKSIAALWGFCVGAYLEQKYVQFTLSSNLKHNIIKCLIGSIGMVILYVGMKKLFPDVQVMNMIGYALVVMWIIVGAPYIFKKFLKA